jgi:hypothetical protein
MKFKRGDRVLMLRHADWKNEATGTITSVRTVPVAMPDGSSDEWYWIEFDELQRDFTGRAKWDESDVQEIDGDRSIFATP